jgi:hypothetical protein
MPTTMPSRDLKSLKGRGVEGIYIEFSKDT